MKSTIKLLALILALVMLLTACDLGGGNTETSTEITTLNETVAESEKPTEKESGTEGQTESNDEAEVETDAPLSDYRASISRTREELESMITLQDSDFDDVQAKLDAFEEIAVVSSDYEAVDSVYMEFEDAFYYLDTQISLSSIVYEMNRSNTEASERYLNGYDKFGDIYNDYMAVCRRAYNESPIRDQLFADWSEEDIKQLLSYDPVTQELREENESLLVEYNELEGTDLATKGGQIYAQIVTNNNRIAQLSGYENYYVYATTEVYGRDYSLEDIEAFKSYIREYLLPEFENLKKDFNSGMNALPKNDYYTLISFIENPFDSGINYVKNYVNSYDNSTGEGFRHLFENRNMVFASAKNSHNSAFQTYLEDYEAPFCLFGVNGQSASTIVHEMGHYYASLHNSNINSYDLAETQSQGNEFLFLKYVSGSMDEAIFEVLEDYNLYDVVAMSIICAIIDDFEQKVYSLESVEGYTIKDFNAIMDEVCKPYGGRSFISSKITSINSYWQAVCPNSPVYYISYATSSLAAVSLYAKAVEDEAGAREAYRKLIEDIEEDDGFKDALAKAGLLDPFKEETFIAINKIITE